MAVFVHGCFWHGHGCELFKWPRTNASFWRAKIERNAARDARIERELTTAGWRVLVVWECALRRLTAERAGDIVDTVRAFVAAQDRVIAHLPGPSSTHMEHK